MKIFSGLLTGKILVTCSYFSGVYKDSLNCILIRSLCVFYEIIRGPYVILSTPTVINMFCWFLLNYCSQQTLDVNTGQRTVCLYWTLKSRYLAYNRSV